MASYLLFVLVVLLPGSVFAEVTFKNVTIWNGFLDNKIVFINSSASLKPFLPSYPFNVVYIIGKIPVLYENSISDINNIKQLHFYENKIQEICPGAFKNLSNVTIIKIGTNNKLTALKKNVFHNLTVEEIFLNENLISSIEVGAFENLPKLTTLILRQNKLETIDGGVFENLVTLKNLDLSSNLIAATPKNIFQKMPRLRALSLSGNKLEEIQEEAFSNSSIEILDLSWNLISSLPKKCFKKMPHFSRLDLSHNKLENIPEDIFNNLTLAVLTLNSNNISVIAPKAFDDMPNLEHINLAANKLTRYNPDWFRNTRNIYRLFLYRNLIEEIPNDAFKNILNSKEIWMDLLGNKIKTIFPNSFRGFKKFYTLNLAKNELESWNENFLADTEAIDHLSLKNNKIKCVEGEFDKIFKANSTHLRGNPLDPQCKERIMSWASKNHKRVFTD